MIDIAIAVNSRYVRYAYVMLTSLFMNNGCDKVTVYVLQSDLTAADRTCLAYLAARFGQTTVFVDVWPERCFAQFPTTQSWTKEIYYRLLVGTLLPETVERLLYLDVDMIVHQPVRELYETDLQGMTLAAADDTMIQGNFSEEQNALFADLGGRVRYFNSGMLLYDLQRLRAECSFDDYLQIAEKAGFRLTNPDQDLLNYVHCGKVLFVDNSRYNVFSQNIALTEETLERLVIIHYAGRKPWNCNDARYEMEKLWWLYAKETPFYVEMMEEVFWDSFSDVSYRKIRALMEENRELKKSLEKAMALCMKLYQGEEPSRS